MTATVLRPRTLAEALDGLRDAPGDVQLLAGGTDLMVEWQTGRTTCEHVIDLWRVEELRGIEITDAGFRIGALTTCAELLRCEAIGSELDILLAAAREVGAVQIQNRATLGGNLGTASPAADLNPVLMALDARVELASASGTRELPVREFLTGYRSTDLRAGELIAAIRIGRRPGGERRAFRKVGTRRAQSISKFVVAVCAVVARDGWSSIRIAAGSIAPGTVMLTGLASELEEASRVKPLDAETVLEAVRRCARDEVQPIDDVRSTAEYRRLVLQRVLTGMICGWV